MFNILFSIDGKEEWYKNYVLRTSVNAGKDEDARWNTQAYSFIENEDGTEGELQPIPELSEDEWNMIEEVQYSFVGELQSGRLYQPNSRNGEELERPVNIFLPTLRNWEELEHI